ncbi:MAG: TolC family protein [Candidatus Omnitrophica bacterium]|nr:TolC family protein [Candidatus Omnitrophota bacterium]
MKILIKSLIIILFLPILVFGADDNTQTEIDDLVKKEYFPTNEFLTLGDCYKLALKQSEIIAIDAEQIKIAEAHFLEAFGTIMPQVSFSHGQTRNQSSNTSLNKTYEAKFTFTQDLFSGFKEFAAIKGSGLEKNQRQQEKWRAEQLLFVDVSDAFYLLLEIQHDLSALKTIEFALNDRVKELKTRQDIGKSRASEVVTTEYQLYSLQAEIQLDRNQELLVRQLLEFLIGKPFDKIAESKFEFNIKPESQYLAEASLRPDVKASYYAWKLNQEKITVARSGFFPSVNLEGDYFSHRSSSPADSKWDALLSVNVPIFEGTTTYGQVKEANSVAKQSELLYGRLGRIALQNIHDAYVNMQISILRRKTLGKALKAAELSYHLQTQDYKLNVVNNLDVLTAIQNLGDVRRSYIHTSYESKRFYWQLLAAAGEISPNTITIIE